MKLIIALLVLFLTAWTTMSQSNVPADKTSSRVSVPVLNEDEGKACVVVGDAFSLVNSAATPPREPKQYSIFLGKGWLGDKTLSRKNQLSNLFGDPSFTDPGLLTQLGWNNIYGFKAYKEHLAAESDPLPDLRIQSILSSIVSSDPAAGEVGDNVYIIYLDPKLSPRLGTLVGSKHYVSYYNAVNIEDGRLRYVVVPYDNDPKTMAANALSGLIAMVFEPNCS